MGKKLISGGIVGIVLLLSVGLAGCSGAVTADSVRLDKVASQIVPASFDEQNSTVMRCASVLEDSGGITVTTSKSKDMKADQLLFILPESNQEVTSVAIVPVTGKEYEYDMTQVKYYRVTAASAASAMEQYGIAYADWQTGAMNSSEKFPCCE